MSWLRGLRIPAAGIAVSTLLFASAAIGASVAGFSASGGTFSEVLLALGLRSAPEISQPTVFPGSEQTIPLVTPQVDPEVPGNVLNQDPAPDLDLTEEPGLSALEVEQPGSPGALPPQNPVSPPGHSGENRGQGVDPPGLGGENPGQGVDPPGPGGNPPSQSGDSPSQGSGNPNLGQGRGGGGEGQAAGDQENNNPGSKGNQP